MLTWMVLTTTCRSKKEMARAGRKSADEEGWKNAATAVDVPETLFTGYDHLDDEGEVLAIDVDGQLTDSADIYQNATVYLDKTPFYAEGGGQASDNGFMSTEDCHAKVISVEKSHGVYAHRVLIEKGTLKKGIECNVASISLSVTRQRGITRRRISCRKRYVM